LTPAVEVLRIPDGGDQRTRRNGADAGHLRESAAEIAASMPCLDLCFELFDLTREFLEVGELWRRIPIDVCWRRCRWRSKRAAVIQLDLRNKQDNCVAFLVV